MRKKAFKVLSLAEPQSTQRNARSTVGSNELLCASRGAIRETIILPTLSAPDGARVNTPTPKALRVYLISSSIPNQVKNISSVLIRLYLWQKKKRIVSATDAHRCTQINADTVTVSSIVINRQRSPHFKRYIYPLLSVSICGKSRSLLL